MSDNQDQTLAAGDLRHMVQVWRVTQGSANSYGQYKPTYAQIQYSPFCALVEQISASEVKNADQLKGLRFYRITMRNRQIDPTDQLVWHNKTLNVSSAVGDPFGIMTIIEATELIAQP